ncbi:MAG: hypothetical protein ABIS36_19580 [Chryseolinea sp.]
MNFRFFFMTVIWSSVGIGFIYGIADKFIQTHGGYVSFAMLAILFTSVIGMMKNIHPKPQKAKKQRA